MTITKGQGKQEYYDARKSRWGDVFPHPSKKKLVVRFEAQVGHIKQSKRTAPERKKRMAKNDNSYQAIFAEIEASKKRVRKQRARIEEEKWTG
jgi:ribosomal protein RSM22 (predicted rRNA methylase)